MIMVEVTKIWWDGERLMAEPVDSAIMYKDNEVAQPDSTCNKTLLAQGKGYPRTCRKCGKGPCVGLAQQALDKKAESARELGLDYEPAQQERPSFAEWTSDHVRDNLHKLKPAQKEPVCGWQREDDDHMPDTWRSDCGVLWTFSDGGPVDNEMKYCCGCGAMLLEKKK